MKITNNQFRTSIDTICSVIETALYRKQNANAEKYITYFFHVLYRCYSKDKFDFEDHEANPLESEFSNFGIRSKYVGFLEYKLSNLFANAILPGSFETFKYINRHFLKTVTQLHEQSHKVGARRLIRTFSEIALSLLQLDDKFSPTERKWFESQSFSIFEYLYPLEGLDHVDVDYLIANLEATLKMMIDQDKPELFGEVMDLLMTRYPLCDVGNGHLYDLEFVRGYEPNIAPKILTLYREPFTEKDLNKIIASYREVLSDLISESEMNEIEEHFFNRYKHNFIRTTLFVSMIYAAFKKQFEFISIYLNAHQPPDADASWASTNFAFGIEDIITLIRLKDEIIESRLLSIRHHGFTVYFYQILSFLLVRANLEEIRFDSISINNVTDAENMEYALGKMKSLVPLKMAQEIDSNLNLDEIKFDAIFDALIDHVKKRKDILEAQTLHAADLDDDKVSGFIDQFVDSVESNSMFNLFAGVNHISLLGKPNENSKIYGLNKLLHKSIFLADKDQRFSEVAAHYGTEEANRKDNTVVRTLLTNSLLVNMDLGSLADYLSEQKETFDIILTSNYHFPFSKDDNNLVKYKYQLDEHQYAKSRYFTGQVMGHFNLFRLNGVLRKNQLLLLNSKKIGTLRCYDPSLIDGKNFRGNFKWSLKDLTRVPNEEFLKIVSETGASEETAKVSVLLKILSNFVFEADNDLLVIIISVND